jgi:peptidoglycan/LPS O-acetylase OafA/YrhL
VSAGLPEPARGAPSRDSKLGYRPALDGIRAVAVLSVIAYHFGYRWAPGGFLGVDVFFVLSGYLITSLLLSEHARTGRIALREFWLRRARRLLPALFLMLIVVAIWISFNASPFELPMRREDLFWTLFYGSNWHFILSGQDYFAQYASASPLRHTWSLAIEEQFYLVWPVLVACALWIGRKRPAVLAGVCAVGIAVSAVAMALLYDPSDPSRAYYGTDTRMHQLLIGALLAILMSRREMLARFRRAAIVVAPIAALVLLVTFATLSDQNSAYYRGLSIVLALTTAALVWAVEVNPRQIVARVLSLRPVAWIGQISYGLYLWHWPVILMITTAPAPLANLPGASTGLNLTRLAVTFGIEIASFYLIEQPIRRGRMPVIGHSGRRFLVATAAAIVLVSGVSFAATSAATPALVGTEVPNCPQFTICVRHQGPTGAPVLAVIGDSMARSLDPAFERLATEHGWTYVLQATDGCRVTHLLTSTTESTASQAMNCYEKTPALQAQLLSAWHPALVVVADRMDLVDVIDSQGHTLAMGSAGNIALSEQALTDIARQFTASGADVALLELPPRLGTECERVSTMDSPACQVMVGSNKTQAAYDAMFERVAPKVPGVSTISLNEAVCPGGLCAPLVHGTVLRYDGIHFTAAGALTLVPTLDKQLEATAALR